MKKFSLINTTLALLMSCTHLYAQNDFDAKSPNTDPFDKLSYPIKSGNSVKIPITVTCNVTKKLQPYTVSINMAESFNGYNGWVTIENNSQKVDSSKTITFNLTITPPKTPNLTVDGQYPFKLYFIVYNKNNTQIYPTFTLPEFKVIVDNTPPLNQLYLFKLKRATTYPYRVVAASIREIYRTPTVSKTIQLVSRAYRI